MKVIATSICRGSGLQVCAAVEFRCDKYRPLHCYLIIPLLVGLQGGLYAPSIFIGAALGSAFGQMAHVVADPIGLSISAPQVQAEGAVPALQATPARRSLCTLSASAWMARAAAQPPFRPCPSQAYALVGVAAMLASNCAVPLTAVLLLFELTRDYLIILPTLAAVGISFWVSSLVAPSVKAAASARRVSSAAAGGMLVPGGRGAGGAGVVAPTVSAGAREGTSGTRGGSLDLVAMATAAASLADAAAAARASGSRDVEGGPLVGLPGEGEEAADAAAAAAAAAACAIMPGPVGADAAAQLAAAAAAGQPLVVACALETSALVVRADTRVQDALLLMHEGDQHVAVVVDADGAPLGVVSREVLQQLVAAVLVAEQQQRREVAAGSSGGSD